MRNSPDPAQLVAEWRTRAQVFAEFGAPDVGRIWALAAQELEEALKAADTEVLTLTHAAAESGFTVGHLSRLIRHGSLANVGRKHAPRVRRGDLPQRNAARAGRPRKLATTTNENVLKLK